MTESAYKFSIIFFSILFFSCQKKVEKTLFKELSIENSGFDFVNKISSAEEFNMIDYLYYYDGGGVAVGDINNDGLSDIYMVANEGDNALFLNLGNMQFKDITESAGVKSSGLWKTGVSMVDVNGDGLLDIYLCRLGKYKGVSGRNELYINNGNLTFSEEAATYNLDFVGFSTQAAFFDMDNDGDLDVYLLNHSVHSENSFGKSSLRLEADSLAGDRIYRNDDNFFVDVSSSSGIYRSKLGYGLGIGLCDINKDGFTDIFISNDFMENDYLYLNNQDGTFQEVFSEMADHTSLSSMGTDLADINNDGLIDIITLDMLPANEVIRKSIVGEDPNEIFRMKLDFGYMPQYKRNTLQLNRGDGTFSDIGMLAGIHATDWSWSPLFADFDNDGWKDLFISNGIPGRPNDLDYLDFIGSDGVLNNPEIPDSILLNKMPTGAVANYFYRNNRDLTFQDYSDKWSVKVNGITQGIAYSDLDNDGDLDLVLNNLNNPSWIMENSMSDDSSSHFLSIKLVGAGKNTAAIGSKIDIFYEGNYQYFEVFPVRGFKSSVDTRIHIGLGTSTTVDSVRVRWPLGVDTTLINPEVDHFIRIVESGTPETKLIEKPSSVFFESISNEDLGVDYIHRENTFIEFNREQLIPHMHSTEGPALAVADVNGDGLDDFFIGGAKYQEGSIYIQGDDRFILQSQPDLVADKLQEDVDAVFMDFDKDGDMDLVVVSGGNEFIDDSPNRQPRLYLNDGIGGFTKLVGIFDGIYQTGSCVATYDFDNDGWEDLFIGSMTVPWNYGVAPQSFLLKNEGGLSVSDVSKMLPREGKLGMINDAEWIDLEGDGHKQLVLAGEWMNLSILSPREERFDEYTIPNSAGWWMTIGHMDYDGDGDQDILVGNLGLNSKLRASKLNPINLYLNDFDQNGKLDAVMTYFKDGHESIFASRDELEKQIPFVRNSFSLNKDYAKATPEEILGDGFTQAKKLQTQELRSGVFINEEDGYDFLAFPTEMQLSFIQDFMIYDFNFDGYKDILSVANLFSATMQEGRYSADRGSVLSTESGQLLSINLLGISIPGDSRRIELITFQGKQLILVAKNNAPIQWLELKQNNENQEQ